MSTFHPEVGVKHSSRRAALPGCSCDLVVELAGRDRVAKTLAVLGLCAENLKRVRTDLHEVIGNEPADWRVRLAGRGPMSSELEQLLAIVRSADSHGYQLLEHAGVSCAVVRKQLIEELRHQQSAGLERQLAAPRPALVRKGARVTANAASVRQSTSRRMQSQRGRAGAAIVDRSTAAAELEQRPPSEPEGRPACERRRGGAPDHERTTIPDRGRGGASDHGRGGASDHEDPTPPERGRRTAPGERRAPPEPSGHAPQLDAEPSEPSPEHTDERSPARSRTTTLRSIRAKSLPPLCGRKTELTRLADALGRCGRRPPAIVGPHGSGRTLLASHLATLFSEPTFVVDATKFSDEQVFATALAEIAEHDGIAIIDDLDHVVADAPPPLLGPLAQAWTRGSPRTVLVVSPHTHARLVHWLPAAADTLDVVHVGALEGDDLIEATAAAAPRILEQHGVELGRDAKIGELVRLADRYLTGLAMPGRGLDLLDLAAARARRCGRAHISRQLWIEIVSERSGLPPGRIETRGDADVLDLEQRIARRVVGHEDAIATIAGLIRRNRAGFGGQRPILTALLLGPSGVGKTELAKSLCSSLYERDDALVRLDMSEYSESHAVARIVGAPPGYVGHESGGALSEALLARPHCVVLLDEIEKAHREVHQLLLQVFDEGRLTDGRGRIVDFRHAALVMTSNLGAERSATGAAAVLEVAKAAFPIELWNRIEAPLVMEPLGAAEMAKICRRLAAQSSDRLFRERGIRYALTQRACDHLCEMAGEDASLGARPLRHLLTREVEGPLADAILRGRLRAGTQVQIDVREGRIVIG